MVLFWLIWFCLALGGAVRLLGTGERIGRRLAVASAARPYRCGCGRRMGAPWPPGGAGVRSP